MPFFLILYATVNNGTQYKWNENAAKISYEVWIINVLYGGNGNNNTKICDGIFFINT